MISISLNDSGMGKSSSSADKYSTIMSGVASSFSYITSVTEAGKYEVSSLRLILSLDGRQSWSNTHHNFNISPSSNGTLLTGGTTLISFEKLQ